MAKNGKSVNDDVSLERELDVQLTDDEMKARGESMSVAELKIERHKAERKRVNALISEQVDLRNKLAHVIDTGLESRTVICKWVAFDKENRWSLVRQDTGAEVESKAMTAGDKQEPLDYSGGGIGPIETVDVSKPLPEAKREKLAAAMKSHKPRKVAAKKAGPKAKSKSSRAHA